jgi:hypothetical protein
MVGSGSTLLGTTHDGRRKSPLRNNKFVRCILIMFLALHHPCKRNAGVDGAGPRLVVHNSDSMPQRMTSDSERATRADHLNTYCMYINMITNWISELLASRPESLRGCAQELHYSRELTDGGGGQLTFCDIVMGPAQTLCRRGCIASRVMLFPCPVRCISTSAAESNPITSTPASQNLSTMEPLQGN